MKTSNKVMAFLLALCLLAGCGAASAETLYIWVGVLPQDTQETAESNTATTITGVSVMLNGTTLMDGACVDGTEAVTFSVTDTVADNTYSYQISLDGTSYSAFSEGATLDSCLPGSSGALYTVYFKVIGDDDPVNNVTVASYDLYYISLTSATITGITVLANGNTLQNGMWMNGSEPITFTVSDTVTPNTYTYQLSTDGVHFNDFTEGNQLTLSNSTRFRTVYFRAIGDNDTVNNVKTVSFSLYYDNEAPALFCKAGTDRALYFFAGDNYSGFVTDGSEKNVTFDGGATWSACLTAYGQNVYTCHVAYTGSGTIPANKLGVKDRAGNITLWGSAITIAESSGGTTGGGGYSGSGGSGGSYGSSSTTVTVNAAASTDTTVTPYAGVDLVVDTGEMTQLAIGEQTLDLSLYRADETTGEATSGEQAPFSAAFAKWDHNEATTTDAEDGDVDTLVLTAVSATGEYDWTFNGSVYKKLAASGIDYLVLQVGDQITALSTAGFTAGLRYNLYRAAGLASKAFDYAVHMGQDGTRVEVSVEGQTYALTDDKTGEFYYYDLYTGTRDLMDRPFGQGSASTEDQQG